MRCCGVAPSNTNLVLLSKKSDTLRLAGTDSVLISEALSFSDKKNIELVDADAT